MPRQLQLSVDDARLLRDIIEELALERTKLSKLSQVSTGWLSTVLGARWQQTKTVEAEMLTRVADVLIGHLRQRPLKPKLSEERVKAIASFLSRYTESATKLMPPKVYAAGGPLPVDADHYIERPLADGKLFYALQAPAFTMIARGPVQSGKSSLLAQLEAKARAKGWETSSFNPWVGSALDGKQPLDIFALTATSLAKTLEAEWGLDPPTGRGIEFREDLSNWLLSALDSAVRKPRLLILDDIGTLGAKTGEEWLSFVRLITNKRAPRDIQISLAIGMTHHFGPYYVRMLEDQSSVVSWDPKIELDWLSPEQAEKIEKVVAGQTLNLYKIFQGQPYLTHAAAKDESFRKAVQRWVKSKKPQDVPPVIGSQPYKRHLKLIKLAIFGPSWQDQTHATRLINSFYSLCVNGPQSVSKENLDEDDKKFLITAKLITEDLKPMLDIYSLVAEDLKDLASSPN
jgi:hypothetical protein